MPRVLRREKAHACAIRKCLPGPDIVRNGLVVDGKLLHPATLLGRFCKGRCSPCTITRTAYCAKVLAAEGLLVGRIFKKLSEFVQMLVVARTSCRIEQLASRLHEVALGAPAQPRAEATPATGMPLPHCGLKCCFDFICA